jgi:hypothetical protein
VLSGTNCWYAAQHAVRAATHGQERKSISDVLYASIVLVKQCESRPDVQSRAMGKFLSFILITIIGQAFCTGHASRMFFLSFLLAKNELGAAGEIALH